MPMGELLLNSLAECRSVVVYLTLDPPEFLIKSNRVGGESGLVAGLDFKSSWDLPEGRFGGFDSHAPPPFCFQ